MPKNKFYDAVIIGAGIAGASVAYFLTRKGMKDVLILEKEAQPGYHATGRAAGVLVEFDLVPSMVDLKIKGGEFLRNPPQGFSEYPLLWKSGILITGQGAVWKVLKQRVPNLTARGVEIRVLSPAEVLAIVPVVSLEHLDGALLFSADGHIDVHELLWSYLRQAKRAGAELRCREEVEGIKTEHNRVSGVLTRRNEYPCRWVIDAAGAWSQKIRSLAGSSPVQLTPLRRTIITFNAPEGLAVANWPLVADQTHQFYFSPESGGLLASPMDEALMEPGDARPDELVVAQALERLRQFAPKILPKALNRKWAGLRTFSSDQSMVIGQDPSLKGFFWLAGQGGAGIETSGVVGRLAADLIIDGRTDIMEVSLFSPERFK
jgi:D-arginine dehydrogenase